VSSGMLRHVALVKTDVSKELSASFIRVTRIGEVGAMLAVTSNRRTLCALVALEEYSPSTSCLPLSVDFLLGLPLNPTR
jgi:hypothetical protein